ncbi:MAG: hypothetical protein KAJ44_03255 [Thermoplasmatales archaeon]|nr:hypothetical protein [Thermoplasmatales archaeon]
MLKKNLAVGITLLFIFSATIPTISGFDYWVQDENQILNLSECKDKIRSYDVYLITVGRIDNLSVNGTSYAFDCVNVRVISRFYSDGSMMYQYLHLKKSNVINSWVYKNSWEFSYTHYYNKDFYRLHIENCNFSGILKPSYIIGVFYLSIDKNSSFYDNELLENDKIKCEDESIILNYSEVYMDFFIGAISDLKIEEDLIRFNATNIFHTYYTKESNHKLRLGVTRLRNNQSYGYGGIEFRGILTSSFICGFFIYK